MESVDDDDVAYQLLLDWSKLLFSSNLVHGRAKGKISAKIVGMGEGY